jgi:hypothetical protein
MKSIITGFVLTAFSAGVFGQAEADSSLWKKGGMVSVTFSQVSLYQWAAGGNNSVSGAGMVNLFANYKDSRQAWENTLDLGYGLIRQGDETRKSNDRIELNSKYGRNASETWLYSAMLNFKTQFANGFNYPDPKVISTFMTPAYLTGSVGMDYKPGEKFSLFLSPLSGKMTMVFDDTISALGNFGVKAGEKFRAEMGGYAKISYKTPIMENVDVATKLDLFSNYLDNPGNIDVNWEILLSMKINEYLAATFNALLIYDDDVNVPREDQSTGPGIQVKEVFGMGFSYKF